MIDKIDKREVGEPSLPPDGGEDFIVSVLEAKEYLGVYDKVIYHALKTGDLVGKKGGSGNRWLISWASLEIYKGRIERGEVETGFPLAVKQVYTTKEAAQLLGIDISRVYQARNIAVIPARTDGDGNYILNQEDLEALRNSRFGKLDHAKGPSDEGAKGPQDRDLWPSDHPNEGETSMIMQQCEEIPAKRNDASLLQSVLSTVFSFLEKRQKTVGIQSFQEVVEPFRVWEFVTPECPLQVIARGMQVQVLADEYQLHLEEQNQALARQVRERDVKLSYLRQKPQARILPEYGQPLSVWVEQRLEGVFVWSDQFPFSAYGLTEDEALAFFRRTLFGYTYWLRTHEKDLTVQEKEQFVMLRSLLMEE